MFSRSADLYDSIYGAFKDYAEEAARVAARLREARPGVRTVLDVACGTGEHILHFRRRHSLEADGLDLDPGLLAIARRKVPEAGFHEADMARFRLDRRFDAVICLFSSIGYLKTLDRVSEALACFREHCGPGGVVVVEPWFGPGVLRTGTGEAREVTAGALRVRRTSEVAVHGDLSEIRFHYRIEDGHEVRELDEVHELGLFTSGQMLDAFRAAGLDAEFDPDGLTGRGLYVARAGAAATSPRRRGSGSGQADRA